MNNNDVTAGSAITTLGHPALGITLLFFGLGYTEVIALPAGA